MERVPTAWPIRPVLVFLIVFSLIFSGYASGAAADTATPTYHTSVAEVRLTFSVNDERHHGVSTLDAKDFAVVDKDFIVRDFQSFSRSDRTRLEVAVLADTSESVTPRLQHEMAGILDLLAKTEGVPEESVSVISFQGVQPVVLCEGNCRASHAADQLTRAQAGGLTPLFDAMVLASRLLARRADDHARKVLIVFSDGEDTISRNSAADALSAAFDNEVQLYTVDLNRPPSAARGTALLEGLARVTGGQSFTLQDGASKVVDAVLEDFHANYMVTYKLPSHASGFHVVRILPTHNQNLEFRCRRGYYYPDTASADNIVPGQGR
jgi:Ca-activated chloride channel family protein